MKLLYQLLLLVGLAASVVGAVLWAKAGFPITFGELSTALFGTKPWHMNKDSGLFLMVLGLVLAGYCAIEINHKRWEKQG